MAATLTAFRDVSEDLFTRLLALSRQENASVGQVATRVLEGALLPEQRKASLDRLMTWSKAEFDEFQVELSHQRRIDV